MRFLITILGLLTILSCDNRDKEKRLFGTLYQNRFSIGDSTTVEYVDSSFYVILTGRDPIEGYTLGKWRVESGLFGTIFINNQTIDSSRLKVTDFTRDLVKFEFEGRTIELLKNEETINIDIIGKWKCFACPALPPLRNSESDEMRVINYLFRNDNSFKIEEEDWRAQGTWKFSKSGQLVVLNNVYKTGDIIKGDLLILNSLNNDTLTLNRKDDMGHLVTRKLIRTQN